MKKTNKLKSKIKKEYLPTVVFLTCAFLPMILVMLFIFFWYVPETATQTQAKYYLPLYLCGVLICIFTWIQITNYKSIVHNVIKRERNRIKFNISKAKTEKLINDNQISFELFKYGNNFTNKNSQLITYCIQPSSKIEGGIDCSILYKSCNAHFFTYSFSFYKGIVNENVEQNSEENIRELFSDDKVMYVLAFGCIENY